MTEYAPVPAYLAQEERYDSMTYRRCGRSGLKLPLLSLGLWHNFGGTSPIELGRQILRRAFGRIFAQDFQHYRDELIISTKAGYDMWPGPYGEWGSRKYLIASLDQSLKRMGLEYVDIFYSHRFDPETPLEETMMALDHIVRQGKALYVGISSYGPQNTSRAFEILKDLGTPCLIHQSSYSMINRWVEEDLLDILGEHGVGLIAFSPLAQGMLTNKYLHGIPEDSRASEDHYFSQSLITEENLKNITALNEIAKGR